LLKYVCLIHKHIFFHGTCIFLSINKLKNDKTGFYKFTCIFTKLKLGINISICPCSTGKTF